MELKNKLDKLKSKCIIDKIPIIRDNTLKFIINFIKENNIGSILEIGTAYGYSAFNFKILSNIKYIVSLEKNLEKFNIAKKYLKSLNISNIDLININAFDYDTNLKFDLVFMDGPKSNQIELFQKFSNYLNPKGIIIIDNLYLNKIRLIDDNLKTKNQKSLINKLDKFIIYLQNLKNYSFELINIDDGIGIVKRYD